MSINCISQAFLILLLVTCNAQTIAPSKAPSNAPSKAPSKSPSNAPSKAPSNAPSKAPSKIPTNAPSRSPTSQPSTRFPTNIPSKVPSSTPTSRRPTTSPTTRPTTFRPSAKPTAAPTIKPTARPTSAPSTKVPTSVPALVPSVQPTSSPSVPTNSPTGKPIAVGKYFDTLYVIILENTDYSTAMADSSFAAVAAKGRLLTNYHGSTHPSLPNYISLGGADYTFGSTTITSDSDINLAYTNIVDLLEAKGVTWKAYNQWYTQGTNGACNTASSITGTAVSATCSSVSSYVRKHSPLMSFTNIQTSLSRCKNIVGASQLAGDSSGNTLLTDINSGNIANVNWYMPDLCNDCHNTGVSKCGPWLKTNFFDSGGYFSNPKAIVGRTLVAVIFDESGTGSYPPFGDQIFGVLIPYGTMTSIKAGETCGAYYTHISLVQMIEDNWSLGNLGRKDDGTSANLYKWGGPMCTDTLANCNTRTYDGTTYPNNAKCSCSTSGNTCA